MQSSLLIIWTCADCGVVLRGSTPVVYPVHCSCGRVERADGRFVRGAKPTLVRIPRPPKEPVEPHAKDTSRGVGDTVAKLTKMLGIKPCAGCEQRRKWLNERFPYGGKSS